MFLRIVVLLYAACVLFTCSGETNYECFSKNVTSKEWRYEAQGHSNMRFKRDVPNTHNLKSSVSEMRMNYSEKLEEGINQQINAELSAHYAYLSMSYHFEQDDNYMPGFSKFFKKMSQEEHEHAQMFMKYQNTRGGRIRLNSIPKPCDDGKWGNGLMAMTKALKLEKHINTMLLDLHQIASKEEAGQTDPQFLDFLESNFLGEQVESIKTISNYVNILYRLNSTQGGLGEYQFDKLTLGGGKD